MRKYIANHVVLDEEAGDVIVDGVRLPWWVAEDPSIEVGEFLCTVYVGIQCHSATWLGLGLTDDEPTLITPLAMRGAINGATWLAGRDHP